VPRKKPPLFTNKVWQDCYVAFLASLRSTATRRSYDCACRQFFTFCANARGKSITPERVRRVEVEAFLRSRKWSAFTHNAYLQSLQQFYAYASEYEIVFRGKSRVLFRDKPPTTGVKRMRTPPTDRAMTEEEIIRFFEAIDRSTLPGKRDYALFWALFITGRRCAEITLLRRGDLDRRGLRWLFWFKGKWRTGKESAEMPEDVIEAIRDFHAAAGRDFDTMDANEPLFPGVTGDAKRGHPMALSHVGRRFHSIASRAGLPPHLVPHSLRWGNAHQRWLAHDKDITKVMAELGWATPTQALHYVQTTQRKEQGDMTAGKIAAKFRK
jgi:integrase/recombinase XerC